MKMKRMIATTIVVTLTLAGCASPASVDPEDPVAIDYVVKSISSIGPVRTQLAEHYMVNGSFPEDNADLGLPEPSAFSVDALESVEVKDDGVIELTYNAKSGLRNAIVQFVPDASEPALGMQWRCVTPSFRGIESWLPGCEYNP